MSRKLKYRILWVLLFGVVIFSLYFLFPEKRVNHDRGSVSAELTQMEITEGNVTKISYVNETGEITYAIDKHYATLMRRRDSEGRLLEEHYLDENGEPTDVGGYFGVSYEHKTKEDIITYLNAKGKPVKINSGHAVIVRSLNESGQAVDDMYYDTEMNPVICTGGYYGLHREYDQDGIVSEIVYWDIDRSPMSILSGFAREKDLFDEENRVVQKFYFDKAGNPVCLKLGQAGEAYTYDENNRINQITYLDQEGNPIVTTAGYTILKKSYYRDGTEETNMYFDSAARPMHLSKGQYGIKRVEDVTLYLDRNGKVMLCIDNILNGYPFMVVIVGILLCLILCLFPVKLRICTLLAYLIFIFYETLMFRETGDTRANLVLFSYAHTFLTNWRIRVDVINNIWLFVPFGTGLYAIFRKKSVWVAALGLSLMIELIQYFTGLGILELDDLFGNTLGSVIGVGIGVIILLKRGRCRVKEKLYSNWLIISAIIIIIGMILDIGVALTGISQFTVTESYMDYIFAAIVSVGLLSFSIIALVAGILQKKFYGYTLGELLTFDGIKKRINLRTYIKMSLFQIILGIVLLSLYFRVSCVNTMICLLVATIFSAGCMAYSVFDIMVNDESVYKILENGYESLIEKDFNKNGKFSYHVNTLTNTLTESCKEHDLDQMEKLCTLYAVLIRVVDKKEDMPWEQVKFVDSRFQQVCCNISTEFGYSKMIEQVVQMFEGVTKYDYWKEDLYLKPILEIKYYDNEKLEKNDYTNHVLSLCVMKEYTNGAITDDEWKTILHQYFYVLIKNEAATSKIKYQMLKKYLGELLYFSRSCDDGEMLVEEEVALDILKYILNTDNIEEQEKLYVLFVRNITVKNQYKKDMHYFLFLSMTFQLIYYYAYSEKEVRTEEYRKSIRNLLNVTIRDATVDGLRVSFLLEANLENILKSFQYRIPEDIPVVDTFEASTDFVIAKEKIWTKEFNIKFLFMLYCQYYDLCGYFFKLSDFLDGNEFTEEEKGRTLKKLNTFFDKETGLLQQSFIKECRQLGELYNHNYELTNIEQDTIFEWIQNKQRQLVYEKLEASEPDEPGNLDVKKITEYLNAIMQRNKIFGWKPEDEMDFCIKYPKVTAIMHYSGETDIVHEETVASFVETYGQEALNWFIKNKCPKLNVSYDEKGINKVLSLLKKTDYSMRNFSYTADWALAEYTKTEQYKSLRERESAIPIHRMNGINEHIYGKKDNFYYKFVVSKAKMENLTEQECLNELERFGKYKEFYYVDGVLLDKERAVECIRRRFYAYEFDFELYIKFDPKDIVWFCHEGEEG